MRNDSKRAQEFAKEIEASIEGLGNIELPSRYSKEFVRNKIDKPNFALLKGQIISKCLFDVFQFSKKPPKNLTNFCPCI